MPGARDSYALGINAAGAISGTYVDGADAQHGIVRDAGGPRTIDIPDAVSTSPATSEFGTGLGTAVGAIRDDGAVAGAWGTRARASHGLVLATDGTRVDLDAPGASTAADPLFQTTDRAARLSATRHKLDHPAAARSVHFAGVALSEAGVVGVLEFGIDGLNGNGWIWSQGHFTRIDPAPLLLLSTVADIAETGVLVGESVTIDGKTHGYIARPVP